jgi:hypothetical protein
MDEAQTQEPEATEEMSVIGGDIEITGNIAATVDLHLIGKVVGDVRCKTLILGEGAEDGLHRAIVRGLPEREPRRLAFRRSRRGPLTRRGG